MRIAFFKGTRKGLSGIYNRGVRWMTLGKYSHCEVVFNDGMSASASLVDGGVRFKNIEYDTSKWDFVELPDSYEHFAKEWFIAHNGEGYDILGNVHFVLPTVRDSKNKWCCSEAVGEALGIKEAWRFHPSSLAAILQTITEK